MRALGLAFLTGARRAAGSPGSLLPNAAFLAMIVLVLSAVWHAVAAGSGGLAGYGLVALIWYSTGGELCVVPTRQRLIREIGDAIADESILAELLRPASVVLMRIADECGQCTVRVLAGAIVTVPVVWLAAGPPPRAGAALLAVPAVALALACNVAAQHVVAACSFWLRDAKSGWLLYQKLVFLLGGMLLPLQALPEAMRAVAWALPFWTMAYPAGRMMSGAVEPLLLLGQLGWLVVLLGAAVALFAAGERRMVRGHA